jgi:hypothetical protein
VLNDLANAEASVSLGGVKASGHLKLSAPAGFGRRHVAPLLREFLQAHPDVTVNLDLSDRLVDLVNEGIDCAVRVGELSDSSLVSVKLAENRRLVVASPDYLARHGAPQTPDDLARHSCLSLGQQRGWLFANPEVAGEVFTLKVAGSFECNDGAVLHDWALAGARQVDKVIRHGVELVVRHDDAQHAAARHVHGECGFDELIVVVVGVDVLPGIGGHVVFSQACITVVWSRLNSRPMRG